MRIYDGFLFYNELDMLEYRLTVLDPYVDEFILVESTVTFAGNPKPLFYSENKARYAKWNAKITHIVVEDTPETTSAWERERWQRNKIADGLRGTTGRSSDALIIADVDEIPNPRILDMLQNLETCDTVSLDMDMYYYTPELKVGTWHHPKITTGKQLRERFHNQVEAIRMSRHKPIERGGWHLSYFGSPEFIQNKLRNFSHQEFNTPKYTSLEFLKERLSKHTNMFDDRVFDVTPLSENEFPPPRLDVLLSFFPVT